ncbi:MAG: hypothetical protein COB37_04465 [Kordiimonadales bacterium]|nr:MAG: hypothetical protein COB37_04465 [Kordiimonadales bacterium]
MISAFQKISLSMVKNEQDIIEPFVRHNLKFVDYMVIADNGSVDDTRNILIKLARETGRVLVLDHRTFEYTQSEFMTKFLHMVQSAFFAEYIIFLDADEFVQAPSRSSFEKSISRIPTGFYGKMPWVSHVLPKNQPLSELKSDPPASIKWRRKSEREQHFKAVLRLGGKIGKELQVSMGNHRIETLDETPIESVNLRDVSLLHFPVRSEEQLIAKGVNGWMAILAKEAKGLELGKNEAHQWKENFERALQPSVMKKDICEASFNYGQRNMVIDWDKDVSNSDHQITYGRKYSDGSYASPLTMVAKSWEGSVKKKALLFNLLKPKSGGNGRVGKADTAFDDKWRWDNLFIDVPPFRFASEILNPNSVLDIGCGIGAYTQLFGALGAGRVMGVDGVKPDQTMLSAKNYRQADITQLKGAKNSFDLIVNLEVLEHREEEGALKVMRMMGLSAEKAIIFSAASLDQPGNGHINCHPIEYWLEHWRTLGWGPDLGMTLGMRAAATFSWFRHNLLVLKPLEQVPGASQAISCLSEIGAKPFRWPGDKPGVKEFILEADLQPFLRAYLQDQ